MTEVSLGSTVEYVDEVGVPHDALVTCVHTPFCINLVYVTKQNDKVDQYGNQLERVSSCTIEGQYVAHGRFFRLKS